MNIVTSEAHFCQQVIRYSQKYGVTAASNRFHRSRQAIYEWKARYDGIGRAVCKLQPDARATYPCQRVQIDVKFVPSYCTSNGAEFTNALLVKTSTHKSLFEQILVDMGILYHRIRVATPRHNGKFEWQHRTNQVLSDYLTILF